MATGIFSLNSYGGFDGSPWWEARCVWTNTPDPAANTSEVNIVIQMRHTNGFVGGGYFTGYYSFWNESLGVEAIPYTTYATADQYTISSEWTTIKSFYFTAQHDSNGNCIIVPTVRAYGAAMSGTDDTYRQTDGTVRMELGGTKQKATLTSALNFTDEINPIIGYTNPMGEAVDSLEASIYDPGGLVVYAAYRAISKTDTSYTFVLTEAERTRLRAATADSDSLQVRFYLRTKINGISYLSSLTRTMTLANVDLGPTLTVSAVDVNSTTTALTGNINKMIRGYSTISYNMTATPYKGSPVVSYEVRCGSQVKTTATGTFYNAESNNIIFTARDARGNASTKTSVLQTIDYVKVSCNQKAKMVRLSDSDAQVRLDLNGNFYNGSFGAKTNTLKIEVRHSVNGGSMGAWQDLSALLYTPSGNTYTFGTNISNLNPSGSYVFQSRVSDLLTSATSEEYTVQLEPVFEWGRTDFQFNVPVTIRGDLTVEGTINGSSSGGTTTPAADPRADYVVSVGTASMGSNGTWYWRKWDSGRAECYGVRNFGNMAATTAWGSLYRSEVFSQALPSGLFTDAPEVVDIVFRSSNFGAWIAKHETSAPTSTNSGSFIVVRPASANLSQANIGFNVIGRWK